MGGLKMSNTALKTKKVDLVWSVTWNNFVRKVYGVPYDISVQEIEDSFEFTVPIRGAEDYQNESYDDIRKKGENGVKFGVWASTKPVGVEKDSAEMQNWEMEFYPCFDMLVNDLFTRGLLPMGNYVMWMG